MRRSIFVVLLLSVLIAISGCSGVFSETYVSKKPHESDTTAASTKQQYAASYPEIYTALTVLVGKIETDGVIVLSNINEQVGRSYLEAACKNLTSMDPMGAYAVADIRFDLGTNAGRLAAAVHIDYSKNITELSSVKTVRTVNQAEEIIGQALERAAESVAVRVEQYEQINFDDLVRRYADLNPASVMEIPKVSVSVYPNNGVSRLVELSFTYENSAKELMKMKTKVESVFTAAELYVKDSASSQNKLQLLYAFLMERFDYELRSSSTPTYALLHEGVGDSRAFACVFAAMCKQAELECRAISGTKDGKAWYWNRVVINNRVYYIDLIDAEKTGKLQLRTSSEMGGYHWDKNL